MFLESLPTEVLRNICIYLDGLSLARLSCTCKVLRKVCKEDSFWRSCVRKEILSNLKEDEIVALANKNPSNKVSWYAVYKSVYGAVAPLREDENLDLTGEDCAFPLILPLVAKDCSFTMSFWFFLVHDADTRDFRSLCFLSPSSPQDIVGSVCLLLGEEDNRCHVCQFLSSEGHNQFIETAGYEQEHFPIACRVHATLKELPLYQWSQIVLIRYPSNSDQSSSTSLEIFLNGESYGVRFALPIEFKQEECLSRLTFGSVQGLSHLPVARGFVSHILFIPRAVDSNGSTAIFYQKCPNMPYSLSWIESARREFDEHWSQVVHASKSCDSCHIFPIKGTVYRCLECFPSYDLCQQCFNSDEFIMGPSKNDHRDDHLFMPLRRPYSFRYFTYFRRHYSSGLMSVGNVSKDTDNIVLGTSYSTEEN
eukprot:jgi/Galph1/5188/GphlegSOOS_G3806.1